MAGRRADKFTQDFMRAQARVPMMRMPPKPSIRLQIKPQNRAEQRGVALRIPRFFGALS